MLAVEPWTQRVRIPWRPLVSFFERRWELLRAFEDQGLVRQFRVHAARIDIRLGDAHHLVIFGQDGLELSLLRPDADHGRMESASRAIWTALDPPQLTRPSMTFQWLMPVEADYDDARRDVAARLLGQPQGAGHADFAALVDGECESPESTYRLEVGVVQASESPMRLAREVGRVGVPAPEAPPSLWPPDTLPDVALFCDSDWDIHNVPDPSIEAVLEQWTTAKEAARQIVSGLFEQLRQGGE